MIRNLCTTPYGSQKSTYAWNVERAQNAETGKWSYRCQPEGPSEATVQFDMGYAPSKVGDVLVCIYSCDVPDRLCLPRNATTQRISGTDTTEGAAVTPRMGWVAGRISEAVGAHELWIFRECGWVTLEGCAVFSQEDWPLVLDMVSAGVLEIPWFATPPALNGTAPQPALMP